MFDIYKFITLIKVKLIILILMIVFMNKGRTKGNEVFNTCKHQLSNQHIFRAGFKLLLLYIFELYYIRKISFKQTTDTSPVQICSIHNIKHNHSKTYRSFQLWTRVYARNIVPYYDKLPLRTGICLWFLNFVFSHDDIIYI